MLTLLTAILLLCLSIEDIRTKKISLWPVFVLAGSGAVFGLYAKGTSYLMEIVVSVAMGLIICAVGIVSDNGIGSGDAWTIMALCMCIGCSKTVTVLFYAFVFCCVCGVLCIWVFRQNRKMKLPFLPFLLAAYGFQNVQECFMGKF